MEVEVKARLHDVNEINTRLQHMDVTLIGEEDQVDLLFNSDVRDLKKSGETLRMRIISNGIGAVLTYKGPHKAGRLKRRLEFNVNVSDHEKLRKILEALGYRQTAIIRKRRKKFCVKNFEISLDHVEKLGRFIEVEVKGEYNLKTEKRLWAVLRELGIKQDDIETRTYAELLESYYHTL